jgi:hypothetical protein
MRHQGQASGFWRGNDIFAAPMDDQERLREQITAAVSEFQKTQMAVSCESIVVDFHDETLLVTYNCLKRSSATPTTTS